MSFIKKCLIGFSRREISVMPSALCSRWNYCPKTVNVVHKFSMRQHFMSSAARTSTQRHGSGVLHPREPSRHVFGHSFKGYIWLVVYETSIVGRCEKCTHTMSAVSVSVCVVVSHPSRWWRRRRRTAPRSLNEGLFKSTVQYPIYCMSYFDYDVYRTWQRYSERAGSDHFHTVVRTCIAYRSTHTLCSFFRVVVFKTRRHFTDRNLNRWFGRLCLMLTARF